MTRLSSGLKWSKSKYTSRFRELCGVITTSDLPLMSPLNRNNALYRLTRHQTILSLLFGLPTAPYCRKPTILLCLCPNTFRNLRQSCITRSSYFLTNGRWPSIEELMSESGPCQLPFLLALQLRHFLDTLPNTQSFGRPLTLTQGIQFQGRYAGSIQNVLLIELPGDSTTSAVF